MKKAKRKSARGKKASKKRVHRINSRAGRPPGALGERTKLLIQAIQGILQRINSPMTTRQVFYQCLSSHAVEATASGYNRVQTLLVDLRRNGTIPADRIVDRTRAMHRVPLWESLVDAFVSMKTFYRRNPFQTQKVVPFIGMEKDALAEVISDVVDEYGAPLFITRGYASVALLQDWADEIRALNMVGKEVRIFYFGDFDPSGLNIPEAIERELTALGVEFKFTVSGLLRSDIVKYKLPPQVLKEDDTRRPKFEKAHGSYGYELDALDPDVLRQKIRDNIESCIDKKAWAELEQMEQQERYELEEYIEDMRRPMQRGEEEPDSQKSEE
jgi:hypothetical protein